MHALLMFGILWVLKYTWIWDQNQVVSYYNFKAKKTVLSQNNKEINYKYINDG